MKQNIMIVYGGESGEHEISKKTAYSILQNIDFDRYSILLMYINESGEWFYQGKRIKRFSTYEEFEAEKNFKNPSGWMYLKEADLVFPVIHGPNGEDGKLQGMLEMMKIPYVGCGVLTSALAMDKIASKQVFESVGISQCKYVSFHKDDFSNPRSDVGKGTIEKIESLLKYPCFVKPANMGSSVGISKAKNRDELLNAIDLAAKYDHRILVEEMIVGREIEVGVLGNCELEFSMIGEISTTSDFYDYESKYENQEVTRLSVPANIPKEIEMKIYSEAIKAFKTIDGRGLSRIDFFYEEETEKVYLNEINTMPGFTPFSMYPMLFKEKGLEYKELINKLIALGFEK